MVGNNGVMGVLWLFVHTRGWRMRNVDIVHEERQENPKKKVRLTPLKTENSWTASKRGNNGVQSEIMDRRSRGPITADEFSRLGLPVLCF